MAIDISGKPNTVLIDPDYPNGRFEDQVPGVSPGTPLNLLTHGDYVQFFQSLMLAAGLAFNGLPDNDPNGYQFIQALKTVAGWDKWVNAGSLTGIVVTPGTFTSITYQYNKYRIVGKTLYWSLSFTGTTAGNVTLIQFDKPAGVSTNLQNGTGYFVGVSDGDKLMIVDISSTAVAFTLPAGAAFTNTAHTFSMNLVIEIA